MAEVSQRILDMVRRELVENPDIDNATLYEKARHLDPAAMEGVDRRQFNARYPLRVKRFEMRARKPQPPRPTRPRKPRAAASGAEAKPEEGAAAEARPRPSREGGGRPRRRARSGAGAAQAGTVPGNLARDGLRDVLLRFATELADAEGRAELVRAVAGVDRYVDEILGMGSSE